MAALTFPTANNYRVENNGSETKMYFIFASIADGDTFTVPLTRLNMAMISSSHTSAAYGSVEIGTATNAGTPLTIHMSATSAARLVVSGH